MSKFENIEVFGRKTKKRAKIIDVIFNHRIAILQEDLNKYGETHNQCATFLIESKSGIFHFQQGWSTYELNKHKLTAELVEKVCEELNKKGQ